MRSVGPGAYFMMNAHIRILSSLNLNASWAKIRSKIPGMLVLVSGGGEETLVFWHTLNPHVVDGVQVNK